MSNTTTKKSLTLDGAKKVIARAAEKAKELNVPGVVAVVDENGSLICMERWDGSMPAAANITIGKAATTAAFRRPTNKLEDLIQNQRLSMLDLSGITDTPYVPLMGGYPIIVNDEIVGAVAVGGALTGENDEIIAKYASETELG